MPRFRYLPAAALAWTLCAVSGCDQRSLSTPAPAAGTRSGAAAYEDASQGNGYAFHIRYPQLPSEWSALAQVLHGYADARKQELLDARAEAETGAGPAHSLDLEFNIARRTADFVSVLADGSSWTGGARPVPLVASFNLHTSDDRLIVLSDLFTDANSALNALSTESRRQLEGRFEAKLRDALPQKDQAKALHDMRERVERGTDAKPGNFDVFLVDGLESRAIGLTLIFPSDQVAADADGPQQIEVPAKVFYNLLKPQFRDAFQIDTDAATLGPGAR